MQFIEIDDYEVGFHAEGIAGRQDAIRRWMQEEATPKNALVVRELIDRQIRDLQELHGVIDTIYMSVDEFAAQEQFEKAFEEKEDDNRPTVIQRIKQKMRGEKN